MLIKWLRKATKNLDAAASYISKDDPEAAQKMYAHIRKSVEALGEHPEIGRPGRIFGTRELVIIDISLSYPIGSEGTKYR